MSKASSRLKLLSALTLGFSALSLSACSYSNIESVEFATDNNVVTVGEFDLSNYYLNVNYRNGESEQIQVDESMIDSNDLFNLYKVGTHDITFYYDNFYTTATFIVEMNHFASDIKFVTNGQYLGEDIFIQKYDGKSHSLELTQNVPSGTQILYPDGNSFSETKNTPYVIKAVLVKDGYATKEITGKMLIVANEFPEEYFSQIKFEDLTEPYNGEEHTIEVENLPDELEVEYKIYDSEGRKVDKAIEAGEYNVYASFTCKDHNYSIPNSKKSKTAKLTISKIDIKCDEVSLEPITKQYDGKSVEIKPTGYVPEGVHYNVVIKDSSGTVVQDPVNAGVYNVEVNFTSDKNHSVQPQKLETTLTINKRVVDLSNVEYGLEEVTFDGTIRRYSLLDQYTNQYVTPKFTYLRYETDEECEPSTGGKYKVLIDYEAIDGDMSNYELVNVPTDPAILIINKKAIDLGNLVYGPEEVKYDGTSKKYTYFDSRVPAYVVPKLTYYALGSNEPCNPIEPGTYTVVVNFEIVESEKANLELIHVPTKSTELIITDISE